MPSSAEILKKIVMDSLRGLDAPVLDIEIRYSDGVDMLSFHLIAARVKRWSTG